MGNDDKIQNMSEKATGKVKEGTGKVTDDESMEAEGKMDQSKADLKLAGENFKDAFTYCGKPLAVRFKRAGICRRF
jgi:uncharacterized protein YjbJ (UPF0337 family)